MTPEKGKKSAFTVRVRRAVYNGRFQTPITKVVYTANDGSKTVLRAGVDYNVMPLSFSKDAFKNVGNWCVNVSAVEGSGYTGNVGKYFKIMPKATKLTSVKAGKGSLKLKWLQRSAANVSYYQVFYKAAGAKAYRSLNVNGYKHTTKTIKKLKRGKAYSLYIRVCKYYKHASDTGSSYFVSAKSKVAKSKKVK
jgi:hypothetical protein